MRNVSQKPTAAVSDYLRLPPRDRGENIIVHFSQKMLTQDLEQRFVDFYHSARKAKVCWKKESAKDTEHMGSLVTVGGSVTAKEVMELLKCVPSNGGVN